MWISYLFLATFCTLTLFGASEKAAFRRKYHETCWSAYRRKYVRGARPDPRVTNLEKCKIKCLSLDVCAGIQWNPAKKRCVIHRSKRIPRLKKTRSNIIQYVPARCKEEVMDIDIRDFTPGDGHRKVLHFKGFEGHNWFLTLEPNTMLFGSLTEFQKRTIQGRITGKGSVPKDCFYIGKADRGEYEAGFAAVTTCGGKIRGYIVTPIQDYEINPILSYDKKRSVRDHIADMIKATVERSESEDNSTILRREEAQHITRRAGTAYTAYLDKQEPYPPGRVLYLDVGAMVDKSFGTLYRTTAGQTDNDIFLGIMTIFNFAQLWYLHPTLGFQVWITVAKVIILDAPLPRVPDRTVTPSYGLLDNCHYFPKVHKDSKDWDIVVIFTENNYMTNKLGGLALIASACQTDMHCAAVKSQGFDISLFTRAVVHEMGHTLGMPDVYPPNKFSQHCFNGMMRNPQHSHDWSRCGTQTFERYLYTKASKCTFAGQSKAKNTNKRPKYAVNVAWRTDARHSSTYRSSEERWGAWKAVDGPFASLQSAETLANPVLASCSRTRREKDPYLVVELHAEHAGNPIDSIFIFSRPERYQRFRDFEVRIGDSANFRKNPVCYFHPGVVPRRKHGSMIVVRCDKVMSGKYVSVQIKGDMRELSLCELQVFQYADLSDFHNPFKCRDTLTFCGDYKKSMGCAGDFEELMRENCTYTCEFCKRKPYVYKENEGRAKTGITPQCGDHVGYCEKVESLKLCKTRSSIEACPKTCGQCGKVHLPKEPDITLPYDM